MDASGTISTFAADIQSRLGLAIDGAGNAVELGRHRIVRISPAGAITVLAGTGTAGFSPDGVSAVAAKPNAPGGVSVGADGLVYFTDRLDFRGRRIDPDGTLRTVAGTGVSASSGDGGPATSAAAVPTSVAVDRAGNVYFSEGGVSGCARSTPAGSSRRARATARPGRPALEPRPRPPS